jgi:4-hydroxy-tetrahydrodipicolinate reductase
VIFDSLSDTIELSHIARSRTGFAAGALLAAEWLRGRTGFFSFDEVLEEFLR